MHPISYAPDPAHRNGASSGEMTGHNESGPCVTTARGASRVREAIVQLTSLSSYWQYAPSDNRVRGLTFSVL